MKYITLATALFCIFCSCIHVAKAYKAHTATEVDLYPFEDFIGYEPLITIPANTEIYVGNKRKGRYRYAEYKGYAGYITNQNFPEEQKIQGHVYKKTMTKSRYSVWLKTQSDKPTTK